MAECSYARCLQERRHIKRELMKWSKDMLYIFGLERVAEELMGHRKWKQYQEGFPKTQFSADITNIDQVDKLSEEISENLKNRQKFDNYAPNIKAFEVIDNTYISSSTKLEKVRNSNEVVTEECLGLNNGRTTSHRINFNNSTENCEVEPQPPTIPKEPPLEAVDWKPNEKCNFCDAGKLLTVNEKGELVAESNPALSEVDHAIRLRGETESDSTESLVPDAKVDVKKVLASHLKGSVSPNMTSLESMAAQWSAIQSSPGLQSGLGQLYPSILYNLTQHVNSATPTTSETSAAAISPSLKDSPSPSDLTGEQPLDLSSKPSPSSSIGGDARQVHRSKNRIAPMSGRRTYTEEELNNALQDIMSGKLGTRRAAVQYNIPRSTLRNKVYKISSGAKRETPTSLQHLASLEDLADMDYDKHDLSADEEDSNGDKVQNSSLLSQTSDDLASHLADVSVQKIHTERKNIAPQHIQCHSLGIEGQPKATPSVESQPKHKPSSPQHPPQEPSPMGQTAWQNVLLHSLLFSGGLPLQQNFEEALQLFNALLLKQDLTRLNPQLLMQLQRSQQSTQQHQITQEQQNLQMNAAEVAKQATSFQSCLPKSETPETESSVDLNEALSDDPTVILKIPSYKPVAVSSTSISSATAASTICSNKNIENLPPTSPKMTTPSILVGPKTSIQQLHHNHNRQSNQHLSASSANNIPITSDSLRCHASGESESPTMLSLRDVIANSISRTFNQQAKIEATSSSPAHSASSAMDYSDQYKRPSISVIKNIGGTDTTRFATAPNLLGSHINSNHQHQHHNQNMVNNNLAGGKGTRPKRGKYRNYDRDSLVEAVKAVQRGEMSVHRAGSYYGVPHSTLEYKVKERHLMRPRKREPKTQPSLDERTGENSSIVNISSSTVNTLKNSNFQGVSAVNSLENYSKSSGAASSSSNQTQSASAKNNPSFSKTSPNGMKISPALFEQSLAAQLQYPPHLFWHGGFGPLQMDFNARSQAATVAAVASASRAGSGNSSLASSSELLKSQMIQRFNEEHAPSNTILGSPPQAVPSNSRSKSVVDIAENLYEPGSDANGSFLDGLIRKTLDRKSSEAKQVALLDELVRNKNAPTSPSSRLFLNNDLMNADFQNMKRSGSPVQYHHSIKIKRERASPTSEFSNSYLDKNNRRYSDSEPQPQSSLSEFHVTGLDHGQISANSDLNGTQLSLMSGSHLRVENVSTTQKSALNTSNQHSKLEHIKSETQDSL